MNATPRLVNYVPGIQGVTSGGIATVNIPVDRRYHSLRILTTNAADVDAALASLIERLESMRPRLTDGGLREDFERGAQLRRRLVNPVQLK